MVFRTCNELNLCVWFDVFGVSFVSFTIVPVVFYRGVVDVGYCFCFRYSNAPFDT